MSHLRREQGNLACYILQYCRLLRKVFHNIHTAHPTEEKLPAGMEEAHHDVINSMQARFTHFTGEWPCEKFTFAGYSRRAVDKQN
jgi:hypothetical protein